MLQEDELDKEEEDVKSFGLIELYILEESIELWGDFLTIIVAEDESVDLV